MNTPKNWNPPPEMPAALPPLPVGKNGKPLTYLGLGATFNRLPGADLYMLDAGQWSQSRPLIIGGYTGTTKDAHYAAESDSEICRLNQWGDFDPRNKSAEPNMPQTTIAAYLASIEAAIKEADARFQEATECAAAWARELQARRDIRDRLQGDTALSRRAWFFAGKKCQKNHGKTPTTFPAMPE